MDTSPYPYIGKSLNRYIRPFFAFAMLLMVTVTMLSEAIYDTGDGILHYQIARWSWKHPELLLHHWGKPVFTLIASPFAQFGYKGVVLFNVLCHIGTAWLTWRIADRMKIPFAFLAGPLVVFAPMSWGVAQSGLTEPLFALALMLGIYFVTAGRNVTAAFIISFLPFVRTEGFLLAPLFGLFFLLRKEYLSMTLLICGTLLYSIAGWIFVHNDILWVFSRNPYMVNEQYGQGSLFHFAGYSEFIFGWAITALICFGLITPLFRRKFTPIHSLAELLLVFGSFAVFFIAHSVFWWKGLFHSYGLTRVMACIIPCAVIISLRGMQLLTYAFSSKRFLVGLTCLLALGLTIYNTMHQHRLVAAPGYHLQAIIDVADKIKNDHLSDRLVFYGNPTVAHLLDKDPFDDKQCVLLYAYADNGTLPQGSIIIWDQHFGPLEFGITEEEFVSNTQLKELFRIDRREQYPDDNIAPYWIVCEAQ